MHIYYAGDSNRVWLQAQNIEKTYIHASYINVSYVDP